MKLDYLYGSRGEDFRFYQLPALLLEAEEYKGLSAQAKILYSVLLSKVALSRRNGWIEEETDRIYIICQQGEMMRLLGCSRPTASKALHELNAVGLLEKKRRGLGRPDIIYVKDFTSINNSGNSDLENERDPEENNSAPETDLDKGRTADIQMENPFTSRSKDSLHPEVKDFYIKKSNIFTSGSKDSLHLDVKDFDTRYIDNKYINNNYIDRDISYQSIYHDSMKESMRGDPGTTESFGDPGIGDFYAVREAVRSQIEYPALIHDQMMDKDRIDNLVELMAGVILSDRESFMISGEYIQSWRVKERFKQLSMSHIRYVLLCMKDTISDIGNIHAYLLTTLYKAPETMAFYYQQRVNHDMQNANTS